MSEEIKTQTTAVNGDVATQSVDESPSSEGEVQQQESAPEVEQTQETTEESAETAVEETKVKAETEDSGKKVPRSAKRIKQLLGDNKKLQEALDTLQNGSTNPFQKNGKEPMFTKEEMETGIDPTTLEQRIQNRVRSETMSVLNQTKRLEKFKSDLATHQTELQELLDEHPEFGEDGVLQEAFMESYKDANVVNGAFLARKSPKQIAQKLLDVKQQSVLKGTSDITGKMVKIASESAVTPKASEPDVEPNESSKYFSKAVKSGSDDDWAQYLKTII